MPTTVINHSLEEPDVHRLDNKEKDPSQCHRYRRSYSFGEHFSQELNNMMMVSRGNQEENLRLQKKADELERLFAEHKRRSFCARGSVSMTGDVMRGSMYDTYMEKREARRREESGRNREREAETRAMRESIKRSLVELMAWYVDKDQFCQHSVSSGQETTLSSNTPSKRGNTKMVRTLSMPRAPSTSRTIEAPISKPPSKPPPPRSLRGSSPNSDFRKENMKPSTATASKASTPPRLSTIPRGKEEKLPRSSPPSGKNPVAPLTPLRSTEEPFLKKGVDVAAGAGVGVSRLKEEEEEADTPNSCSLSSSCGEITSSWLLQESGRVRKKWGSAQVPFVASDDSAKGLKRFLQFGKKSKRVECRESAGYDEDIVSDFYSFSEGMSLHEQGACLLCVLNRFLRVFS